MDVFDTEIAPFVGQVSIVMYWEATKETMVWQKSLAREQLLASIHTGYHCFWMALCVEELAVFPALSKAEGHPSPCSCRLKADRRESIIKHTEVTQRWRDLFSLMIFRTASCRFSSYIVLNQRFAASHARARRVPRQHRFLGMQCPFPFHLAKRNKEFTTTTRTYE